MARRAKLKNVVKKCEDADAWQAYVDNSDKILVVADIFQTWCGPCEVMRPTFERLYLENDQCDSRCLFISVDSSVFTDEQKEGLPLHEGCKPLFLVFKHKVIIGKVEGVNAPELVTLVSENIFPAAEAE